MNPETSPSVRKRRLTLPETQQGEPAFNEIDVASCATIYFSAEDRSHPVEHLFDKRCRPGTSRWISDRENVTEQIVLEFDTPVDIGRLLYECEETQAERTQEIRIEHSTNGGKSYVRSLVQEHNFSPNGSTYQRENLNLGLRQVDHLRFTIVPDKNGSGRATMSCIRLFSST